MSSHTKAEPTTISGLPSVILAQFVRFPKSIQFLKHARNTVLQSLFSSRFYAFLLRAVKHEELNKLGSDPWPGDASSANAIFQGRYRFGNSEVRLFNKTPWAIQPPSAEWAEEINTFEWLRDFRADGGQAAREGARELVRRWIDIHSIWQPLAWRPDILGRRLMAWCSHADFLLQDSDPNFSLEFLTSLVRQSRHLKYAWPLAPAGSGILAALAGLITSHICFGREHRIVHSVSKRLESEIRNQILGDGCHISRNPSEQLHVLRNLIWLNKCLAAAEVPVPVILINAIDHMGPILGLFRHGDGALALFHGSLEENRNLITETLATLPGNIEPISSASQGNYERMDAGQALVFIDVGPPSPDPFSAKAHAGTLAIEFSIGHERLIVNCGHREDNGWLDACRATAAHSTATLNETNSSTIASEGLRARPHRINISRQENNGNLWLSADHDGYLERFGLLHRRRTYLSSEGTTFRGEDIFEGPGIGGHFPNFDLRFHLHPDVRASLTSDGALLRLPSGVGWHFRFTGGNLGLKDSIYLGQPGEIRRSEQIIISGMVADEGSTVRWAFSLIETD